MKKIKDMLLKHGEHAPRYAYGALRAKSRGFWAMPYMIALRLRFLHIIGRVTGSYYLENMLILDLWEERKYGRGIR